MVLRALVALAAALVVCVPAASGSKPAGPLALVTAETVNRLVVVRLPSGQVVKRLAMPSGPENVETESDLAVVVSPRAGAVTIVDAHRLRVDKILRGFGSPHIAAFSRDGKLVYVTDDARGQLDVIRLACRCVVRRLFVGRGAHHLSSNPDGARLWIVLGERARRVVIVDASTPEAPTVVGRLTPPGEAHDVAFSPDGTRVWMTFSDRASVAVLDSRTHRVVRTVPAGSPPQHVAFGRFVYVTSGNDGELRLFSRRTGRLVGTAATPTGSYNLALGGGIVATSSLVNGRLTELDARGRRLLDERIAPAARDVALVVP